MPSIAAIAEESYVHEEDAREMLVWLVGDGAELDPEVIPREYADAITAYLYADVRALHYTPSSIAGDLATEYRQTHDEALLDELRERGHARIADWLLFEQPQPGDDASVLATREQTRLHLDGILDGGPPDPHRGPRHFKSIDGR